VPKVFDWRGYRFHFYSYEGSPREPIHVHVAKPGADAKFWLFPDVRLARNNGMSAREIRLLRSQIADRKAEIVEKWNAFFAE